ncbi:GNAT family N-acetyltransferase [Enterococcus alishanensis]|uniref:GNAT family N-acetyltransferase n=1 Tax=Enterococcus alishanensis TaxID=1303817 RepID=A0ABS6TCL7_9ENTE|nr:GNAT family N-acetyltransferase [Enterococcus alishanensis]MBV7390626.1 GNAT family N-acetyltransferase [Enterococcus alishanensis]
MITFRKMKKTDVPKLYEMALRAFQSDFEKYGIYPPLLHLKKKNFQPPLLFGKVILADGNEIGGVFVIVLGKKAELATIFIDPKYQHQGYGKEILSALEAAHPHVKKWTLETVSENFQLHRFYESLGYHKVGEKKDPRSDVITYLYEKKIKEQSSIN